ncbi:hypothetical protein ACHQM5_004232 [Ranunculus cassubicifolius]
MEKTQREMGRPRFKEEIEFMDLPWGIICSILSRLPLKSIGQFMCVSKSFCGIKNDSYFVELHMRNAKFQPVNYILKEIPEFAEFRKQFYFPTENPDISRDDQDKTLYLVGEEKENMNMTKIQIIDELRHETLRLVGSCNGLLCFSRGKDDRLSESIIIYNPITREYMQVPATSSNVGPMYSAFNVRISFVFDAISRKYKLVVIHCVNRYGKGLEAYILTLGEDSWRIWKLSSELQFRKFSEDEKSVLFNGSLYWIVENITGSAPMRVLLSMEISSEKFQVISMNDPILQNPPTPCTHYFLLNSGNSLELAVHDYSDKQKRMNVWVLVDTKRGIWRHQSTHYLGRFLEYKKDPKKFPCKKKIEMSDPEYYNCRMKKNAGGDSLLVEYDYFDESLRDTTYILGPGLRHLVCYTPREKRFSIDFHSDTEIPDFFDIFTFWPSFVSPKF